MTETALVSSERIERSILPIRGHRVMLDAYLAVLYGVKTKALVQAVKRNPKRFPENFMFQLSQEELEKWRSQIVTSNPAARMALRRRRFAFTEQCVAMLSSVLRSERAAEVNVAIMRVFVQLRQMLIANKELVRRLDALEKKSDARFHAVFVAIRKLRKRRRLRLVGFRIPGQWK